MLFLTGSADTEGTLDAEGYNCLRPEVQKGLDEHSAARAAENDAATARAPEIITNTTVDGGESKKKKGKKKEVVFPTESLDDV
jgi:hypothetical protein